MRALGDLRSGLYVRSLIMLLQKFISAFADSTSTSFQPFFLNFYKVHVLATHFIFRYGLLLDKYDEETEFP